MGKDIAVVAGDLVVPASRIAEPVAREQAAGSDELAGAAETGPASRNQRGMVSAEWAVGIVAAVAIAGVLLAVVVAGRPLGRALFLRMSAATFRTAGTALAVLAGVGSVVAGLAS